MNERIAELKAQCIVREQRGTNAFDSYMVDRFDSEKFAELIVYDMLGELTNDDSLGPTRIEAIGRLALRYGVAR